MFWNNYNIAAGRVKAIALNNRTLVHIKVRVKWKIIQNIYANLIMMFMNKNKTKTRVYSVKLRRNR